MLGATLVDQFSIPFEEGFHLIEIAQISCGMDIKLGSLFQQIIGNRVMPFESSDAVAADVDKVGTVVGSPSINICFTPNQVFDHRQLAPVSGLPKHRSTMGSDMMNPIGTLPQDLSNGWDISPGGKCDAYLEKIT